MADDKGKKPAPKPEFNISFETFVTDSLMVIFFLFILAALLGRVALVFGGDASSSGLLSLFHLDGFVSWFKYSAYPIIKIISALLSVLFLWGTIFAVRRMSKITEEDRKKYNLGTVGAIAKTEEKTTTVLQSSKLDFSKKWNEVLKHASSNNVNDWKIAILDADSILDSALIAKGYGGDTMGDRLKAIERGDLRNLDLAWEAHKYRNGLAHGDEVEFNQHEVRRVISHFEKVLKELGVI